MFEKPLADEPNESQRLNWKPNWRYRTRWQAVSLQVVESHENDLFQDYLLASSPLMAKNRKAEVDAAQKLIDVKKNQYQIVLETSLGNITLDMFADVAPGHCENMLALANIGYYDGLIFHRVIRGFMIQGGCSEGTGTGGPGYMIKAEFNATKHEPGVLSMARTSDPNSAGAQFFICLENVPHLDRQYTAFGKTADAESLAVVRKIGAVQVGGQDRPVKPVTIVKAKVVEKPKG